MNSSTALSVTDKVSRRIALLNILQGTINRLSNSAAIIKGVSATVLSALLAFSANKDMSFTPWFFIAPGFTFWGFHAYFLQQERAFRALYNREAAKPGDEDANFVIDPATLKGVRESLIKTLFRSAVFWFHMPLISAFVAVYALCGR